MQRSVESAIAEEPRAQETTLQNMALEASSVHTNLPGLQKTRITTPQNAHPLVFRSGFLFFIK